jgi:tetratricopeptide (TPR) repeat protein
MKKMRMRINTLLGPAVLAVWVLSGSSAGATARAGLGMAQAAGGQAAAKGPQWKSREEYDAYQAMAKETDPHKKIAAAEAVIAKYPNSDFKDIAYVQEVGAYQQLGQSDQAIAAAKKALGVNPDNLDALTYLCFAFPFVYNAKGADASAQLDQTDQYAKHGLDVLGKLQKPAQVSDEQFTSYVKAKRAIFNNAIGFVALQKKDYAASMTALKAAMQDNPTDPLTFSMLGQDYLYSNPPDYDNAIWNLARSVALAQAANSPNAANLQKFYDQVYTSRHGSNAGEADIVTQAKASPTPPPDFKVAPAPKHAATGNAFIDAFYNYEDSLKVGGDTAQAAWAQIKGQPFGGPGFVEGVDKQPDGTFLVHVAITDESKASGATDVDLKDAQPGCADLSKGDPVAFKGTLASFTATPNFVLTLDGATIDDQFLQAAADKKKAEQQKTAPKRRTTRRPSGSR